MSTYYEQMMRFVLAMVSADGEINASEMRFLKNAFRKHLSHHQQKPWQARISSSVRSKWTYFHLVMKLGSISASPKCGVYYLEAFLDRLKKPYF